MKNITLVVMAAGLGSRFGGGIKQLEPVGPNGEIIMEYAVYDAIQAGFNKVVFIIRKDIEEDFKQILGNKISANVVVDYVFQEREDLPQGYTCPDDRVKPWGTGHAVLCAKGAVHEPFAVINADDYYGREAFQKMYQFLARENPTGSYCMAGFILKNTLSENGGVTRGISVADSQGRLVRIKETKDIARNKNGVILSGATGEVLDQNNYVSMNMWGFTTDFMERLHEGFEEFLSGLDKDNILTEEFLLPNIIAGLLCNGEVSVQVLETKDKWFGVTYKEDKADVVKEICLLVESKQYPENLFG